MIKLNCESPSLVSLESHIGVFHAMCQSVLIMRSTELAFGNLIVLENILHQLCKALGISIVGAACVTGLLSNMLNDIPLSR